MYICSRSLEKLLLCFEYKKIETAKSFLRRQLSDGTERKKVSLLNGHESSCMLKLTLFEFHLTPFTKRIDCPGKTIYSVNSIFQPFPLPFEEALAGLSFSKLCHLSSRVLVNHSTSFTIVDQYSRHYWYLLVPYSLAKHNS